MALGMFLAGILLAGVSAFPNNKSTDSMDTWKEFHSSFGSFSLPPIDELTVPTDDESFSTFSTTRDDSFSSSNSVKFLLPPRFPK
jgi:hypothetical protein